MVTADVKLAAPRPGVRRWQTLFNLPGPRHSASNNTPWWLPPLSNWQHIDRRTRATKAIQSVPETQRSVSTSTPWWKPPLPNWWHIHRAHTGNESYDWVCTHDNNIFVDADVSITTGYAHHSLESWTQWWMLSGLIARSYPSPTWYAKIWLEVVRLVK